jgi:hypothetical protein
MVVTIDRSFWARKEIRLGELDEDDPYVIEGLKTSQDV